MRIVEGKARKEEKGGEKERERKRKRRAAGLYGWECERPNQFDLTSN